MKKSQPSRLHKFKSQGSSRVAFRAIRRALHNVATIPKFRSQFGKDADAILRYYALINIIIGRVDFSWEKEWRIKGHFPFKFDCLVAIIAPNPKSFRRMVDKSFGSKLRNEIIRIPVICPEWNYEQLVEEMTFRIWESRDQQ